MAMTWIWYLLSQHPAEEAKLHAELTTVLGGRVPNSEDLSKLTYAKMVIEESMRIYPPVHTIAREALADDTLAGRHVPKGSAVLIASRIFPSAAGVVSALERLSPRRKRRYCSPPWRSATGSDSWQGIPSNLRV
jgi:hypothetical protein